MSATISRLAHTYAELVSPGMWSLGNWVSLAHESERLYVSPDCLTWSLCPNCTDSGHRWKVTPFVSHKYVRQLCGPKRIAIDIKGCTTHASRSIGFFGQHSKRILNENVDTMESASFSRAQILRSSSVRHCDSYMDSLSSSGRNSSQHNGLRSNGKCRSDWQRMKTSMYALIF